ESGKSFDPKIVDIMRRRYVELEQMARTGHHAERPKLETDLKIERGAAPAAGFEKSDGDVSRSVTRLHEGILGAQQLADFAGQLRGSIPFDALAIFVEQNERLVPAFVHGEVADQLSRLQIPVGKGLIGWVAENHKPIVNANPKVDPGFPMDSEC